MAGCEGNKENYRIAYENEVKAVRAAHGDWDDFHVKVAAADFLRPRFAADMASEKGEIKGDKEGKEMDIELTPDGDLLFKKYNITLTQLNENTKKYTPWQYHPEDEKTNAAIREAFALGASRVVTSYWRPGEDHRDFVVMEINKKTGKGTSKSINAEALTGKTYGLKEMSEQAQNLFSGLEISFPDEKVFVATDISLDKTEMKTAVNRAETQDVTMTPVYEGPTETLIDVISLMREEREEVTEFIPEVVLYDILTDKKNEHIVTALSTEPVDVTEEDLPIVWKKRAEELLHITSEQSEALLVEVTETWTMMNDAREVISFVNDTGVGIAAAFYAIDKMTLTDEIHDEEQVAQKDVAIIELVGEMDKFAGAGIFALQELAEPVDNIALTEKESEAVFSLFTPEEKTEHVEKKYIPDSVDIVVLESTVEFVRKIDALPPEEQKEAIEKEKEKIEEKIIRVWEAITEMKPEEKQVEQFSFAFSIWTLFKLLNYRAALDAIVPHHSLLAHIQKEKPEGLIQKEPAPWLLYAIIWYLAMMREQGMQTQQAPPVKKKKKRKDVVIYAYAT